ncbi:nitronate monooxygenase [Micrococcales bacterium 31B]|nr:nitronate monooxygenase [Micrococcales bacterium 31B]
MQTSPQPHPGQPNIPLVAAPMAGGPSTPALVRAAVAAGATAFLAGGYKTAAALEAEIKAVRDILPRVGVNLFVPPFDAAGRATGQHLSRETAGAFAAYARALAPEAAALGVELDPRPVEDDSDFWEAKLDLLESMRVPLVSLTFGLPPAADVRRLQRVGSRVYATVTTPGEADTALALGVDGLVVQGTGAGGHSATHDPARPVTAHATADLVRDIAARTRVPLIGAGGVASAADVESILDAGATSVAVGTLLLLAREAGTNPTHRAALAAAVAGERPAETALTSAFTGRPARALNNRFMRDHDAAAPLAYPAVHHLTRSLRQAAAAAGDAERLHLWAGEGVAAVREGTAGEILRGLVPAR